MRLLRYGIGLRLLSYGATAVVTWRAVAAINIIRCECKAALAGCGCYHALRLLRYAYRVAACIIRCGRGVVVMWW